MTWEIFLGIAALVAFIISVGKIISNNTKALTQLQCTIDSLKETIKRDEKHLHSLSDKVVEHETRISLIEQQEG